MERVSAGHLSDRGMQGTVGVAPSSWDTISWNRRARSAGSARCPSSEASLSTTGWRRRSQDSQMRRMHVQQLSLPELAAEVAELLRGFQAQRCLFLIL